MHRTIQTAYLILKHSDNLKFNKEFVVLPCSHELNYFNSTNCDGANAFIPRSTENISKCENKHKTSTSCTECCNFIMKYANNTPPTLSDLQVVIDWSKYNNFYYEKNKNCKDTNMIKESINILLNETSSENVILKSSKKSLFL